MDPTQRFSNRVDNYVKYRPGYPAELLAYLRANCGLTPETVVVDVGSGTGKLTRLFLENGNAVYGVEPNADMRQAAELVLADFPGFHSVAAPAEATTLPANLAGLVVAGQAFHWFNAPAAVAEFTRILKSGGRVALVWNERDVAVPFHNAYEQMLTKYALEYRAVDHKQVGAAQLQSLFGAAVTTQIFGYTQEFDFEGLKGRLLSSSYAPLAGHPHHEPMLQELRRIFEAHQRDGKVSFIYQTKVYVIQL